MPPCWCDVALAALRNTVCPGWPHARPPSSHRLPRPPLRRGAPIEAAGILALLATLVGVYSLPGVAIVCLVVPAQYYFGFRIIKNKVANQPNTNERFSVIQVGVGRGAGVRVEGLGAKDGADRAMQHSSSHSRLAPLPPAPGVRARQRPQATAFPAAPLLTPARAGDPARHEAGQVLCLGALLRGAGEPLFRLLCVWCCGRCCYCICCCRGALRHACWT